MNSLQPISFREACSFVDENHRHHDAPQGWLFGVAVNDGESVVGVAMVGRPVARHLQNGFTCEVTRCCVLPGNPNVCSMLYGACWRAAKALGYRRIVTYTLATEDGASLRGSGWSIVATSRGGTWSRGGRPRVDTHPLQTKLRWEPT